jgi:hypothetical protein
MDRARIFTDVFNDLPDNGKTGVYQQIIIDELASTGMFHESDTRTA